MKTNICSITLTFLIAISSFTSCKNDKPGTGSTGTESATTETEYSDADYSSGFVGSFNMNMQTFKDGTADTKTLPTSTFYSDGKLTAIEIQLGEDASKKSRIIMDPATKTMTTLMDAGGKKMALKMKIPDVNSSVNTDAETDASINETGETKNIEGYKCRKYIITSSSSTIECWMTRQIKGNMSNIFNSGSKDNSQEWAEKLKGMNGFPLEIKTQKKDSKDYVVITLSDIKTGSVDESVFSTEGYSVQDMSNMSNMIENMAKKAQE